jgi:hypothetical protein
VKRRLAALPLLFVGASVVLGCTSYERGRLAMASVRKIEAPFTIIKQDAEGTSCASMFDARYEQAVQDALARASGANALVGASWYFERLCITVRGTAVHFPQPLPLPVGDDHPDSSG